MNIYEKLGIVGLVIIILIQVFGFIGWIMNIVKFAKLDFQQPIKTEVVRGIGMVTPIGAITGWINIKD